MLKQENFFFGGDHEAGLHPKAVEAFTEASLGFVPSYGADKYTAELRERVESLLGVKATIFPVTSGTAANILALQAATEGRTFHSIITPQISHIGVHENNAIPVHTGAMIHKVSSEKGIIVPSQIEAVLERRPKESVFPQPKVVSITNATEIGTVWTPEEVKGIADVCCKNGLHLFLDGARLANAVVAQNSSLKEMTVDLGVDVFTLGGVKNGALADLLVILNPELAKDMKFYVKQLGQETALQRFYSATLLALMKDDLWLRNAQEANYMAAELFALIKDNKGLEFSYPVETNMVWPWLDRGAAELIQEEIACYEEFEETGGDTHKQHLKEDKALLRFVTSWKHAFGADIKPAAEVINRNADPKKIL